MTRGYDTFGGGSGDVFTGGRLTGEISGVAVGLTNTNTLAVTTNTATTASTTSAASAADTIAFALTNLLPDVDTYLDRANGNTAFGSAASLLCKQNTAVVNDDKKTYIAYDLRGFTGLVANGGSSLDITVSHNAGVTQTLSVQVYTNAAQPVSNTSTWNANEPPPGTLRASPTVQVTAGAASRVSVPLGPAAVDAALGTGWLYVRLLGNTAIGGDVVTFTTTSREAASNRPTLNLNVRLA